VAVPEIARDYARAGTVTTGPFGIIDLTA